MPCRQRRWSMGGWARPEFTCVDRAGPAAAVGPLRGARRGRGAPRPPAVQCAGVCRQGHTRLTHGIPGRTNLQNRDLAPALGLGLVGALTSRMCSVASAEVAPPGTTECCPVWRRRRCRSLCRRCTTGSGSAKASPRAWEGPGRGGHRLSCPMRLDDGTEADRAARRVGGSGQWSPAGSQGTGE
jgi:hypothetical protein